MYRTVSGGTAVEERIFANTPQEMVTMYHGSGNDGLLMTHYCMLGNQPRLYLEITDRKAFDFRFLNVAGIDRKKTGHMGGMKMTILDEILSNRNGLILRVVKLRIQVNLSLQENKT